MGMDPHKQLVVKSNDIIQKARYNLTENEQKIIALCTALIKPDMTEIPTFKIPAEKFAELCGIEKHRMYSEFKSMVESLDKKAIWIKNPDGKVIRFRWFPYAAYHAGKGFVELTFHRDLKPYLLELTKNYTKYELWNIFCMKGKYSIRMYELLKSYLNLGHIKLELEDLKAKLCAENYKNFRDFRERVLVKSLEEINNKTDIIASYDVETKGRGGKVTDITFHIKLKPEKVIDATYSHFKYMLNKENEQVEGQMSFFDYDDFIYSEDDIETPNEYLAAEANEKENLTTDAVTNSENDPRKLEENDILDRLKKRKKNT